MKTEPLDFLLSGIALAAIAALAAAVVAFGVHPFSSRWLGAYFVLADALAALLVFGIFCALAVRLLVAIWPLTPGRYAMESAVFTRWKLAAVLYEFGRLALAPFTHSASRPGIAKLFGAKVGRNVALAGAVADPSLVSIGDDAVVGHNSTLTPHAITSGHIILERVSVGRGATVGVNVVVMAGAQIGDEAVVAAGAVVAPFTVIPPRELWGGMPARKIKSLEAADVRG